MNPLILNEEGRAELVALRALADSKPVDLIALVERMKLPKPRQAHKAAMTLQTVRLPVDYFVTLSIETGHPAGRCRHMSMSNGRKGKLPHPTAMWMIAEVLGFVGSFDDCTVWAEDLSDGGQAINIVQPVAN